MSEKWTSGRRRISSEPTDCDIEGSESCAGLGWVTVRREPKWTTAVTNVCLLKMAWRFWGGNGGSCSRTSYLPARFVFRNGNFRNHEMWDCGRSDAGVHVGGDFGCFLNLEWPTHELLGRVWTDPVWSNSRVLRPDGSAGPPGSGLVVALWFLQQQPVCLLSLLPSASPREPPLLPPPLQPRRPPHEWAGEHEQGQRRPTRWRQPRLFSPLQSKGTTNSTQISGRLTVELKCFKIFNQEEKKSSSMWNIRGKQGDGVTLIRGYLQLF